MPSAQESQSPELPLGLQAGREPEPTPAREDAISFKGRRLPPDATPMRLLGVDYVHVPTANGGDLYLTRFGLPFLEHLQLENWRDDVWFEEKRERLKGTSVVYRIPTKVVNGRALDLVAAKPKEEKPAAKPAASSASIAGGWSPQTWAMVRTAPFITRTRCPLSSTW